MTLLDSMGTIFSALQLQLDRMIVEVSTASERRDFRPGLTSLVRICWKFASLAGHVLDVLKDKADRHVRGARPSRSNLRLQSQREKLLENLVQLAQNFHLDLLSRDDQKTVNGGCVCGSKPPEPSSARSHDEPCEQLRIFVQLPPVTCVHDLLDDPMALPQ